MTITKNFATKFKITEAIATDILKMLQSRSAAAVVDFCAQSRTYKVLLTPYLDAAQSGNRITDAEYTQAKRNFQNDLMKFMIANKK